MPAMPPTASIPLGGGVDAPSAPMYAMPGTGKLGDRVDPRDASSVACSHGPVFGSSVRDQRPQPDHEADDADDHEDEADGADVDASQAHRYGELQDRPDGDGEKRDSDTHMCPQPCVANALRVEHPGQNAICCMGRSYGRRLRCPRSEGPVRETRR